jgi:hypothetical protein
MNNDINNALLAKLGLQPEMLQREPDPVIFDESLYERYISEEYRHSQRRETDEIYRMYEPTFLHRASGLRITCTETENYTGDEVTIKILAVFVITREGENLPVTDIDFNWQIATTPHGNIPFMALKKDSLGD